MTIESTTIGKDAIKSILIQNNPWWATGSVLKIYEQYPIRYVHQYIYPAVKEIQLRRGVVISGMQNAGKTVLIQQIIAQLISKKVSPHKIAYVNMEHPILQQLSLSKIFEICKEITGESEDKGWYFFIDEIGFLDKWEFQFENLISTLVDTKFTAICSYNKSENFKELSHGKVIHEHLIPLTFYEYIHLFNLDHLIIPKEIDWEGNTFSHFDTTHINLLNKHFIKYINFGGFPQILQSDIETIDSTEYPNTILKPNFSWEFAWEYGVQNIAELKNLFYQLAYYSGQEFSLESISKIMPLTEKNTIRKYIKILENLQLIRVLERVNLDLKKYERAIYFKVYITQFSYRSLLFSPLTSTDDLIPHLVQTAIMSQWHPVENNGVSYAGWVNGRTQGSVDLVGNDPRDYNKKWAIQLNWSNHYYNNFFDSKDLFSLCKTNKITSALITTIDKTDSKVSNKVKYHFMPAALYAYTLGYNHIIHKSLMYR